MASVSIVLNFLKTRVGQILLALLIGLSIGAWVWNHYHPPTTIIKNVEGKTITIEKPIIKTNDVTKYIQDPAQATLVKKVMAENKGLSVKVTQLQTLLATNSSHGGTENGGTITKGGSTDSGPTRIKCQEDCSKTSSHQSTFKDWQLTATFSGEAFSYDLKQVFTVVASRGRDSQGNQVGLVHLYQKGPDGKPILIPAEVTNIFADEASSRFLIGLRVQGGFGYTKDKQVGGVIALQWLKHGKSEDMNEVRWGYLEPAAFVNQTTKDVGVIPMSFNLGTIPHSPFTNLFVGPYVGKGKQAVVIVATF